jgi:hypothetical protein
MFAQTNEDWKAFDFINYLSNITNKNIQDIMLELVESAMTGKILSKENRDIICYVLFHSTFPISDEKIEEWELIK